MKLTLDREDLKLEHQNVNCSQTRFWHFTEEVQSAIIVVGKAQFREYDGSNYNAIYPAERAAQPCGAVDSPPAAVSENSDGQMAASH